MRTKIINNQKNFTRYALIWGLWLAGLLILNWLDKITIAVPYVGDIAFITVSITFGIYFGIFRLQRKKLNREILFITCLFFLLAMIYGLGAIYHPYKNIKSLAQILLVSLFFFGASHVLYQKIIIKILANLWIGLSILNLIIWVGNRHPYPFNGIFAHKNTLGIMMALGLFFIVAAKFTTRNLRWWWSIGISINLIVLLASGSRASWFLLIVATIVYFFWPIITAKFWISMLVFCLVFFGVLGFVFYYVELYTLNQLSELSNLVIQYTGQNLYSGRQLIWASLIEQIQQNPWGFGPGAIPEILLGVEFSSHNLYLQVALQVGYIGLAVVGVILASIWIILTRKAGDKLVRLSASFLLGVLVHQAFEVSLLQNNLTVGLVIWSIIATGVGRAVFTTNTLKVVEG